MQQAGRHTVVNTAGSSRHLIGEPLCSSCILDTIETVRARSSVDQFIPIVAKK